MPGLSVMSLISQVPTMSVGQGIVPPVFAMSSVASQIIP